MTTPGRIAFNIMMGVDQDSDDFDFQPRAQQEAWEKAVREAIAQIKKTDQELINRIAKAIQRSSNDPDFSELDPGFKAFQQATSQNRQRHASGCLGYLEEEWEAFAAGFEYFRYLVNAETDGK